MEKAVSSVGNVLMMARGAIMDGFEREMDNVMANICDSRTKATAKRKVTVEITFIPSDDRTDIEMRAVCKSKLAPGNDVVSVLYMGRDENGCPMLNEMN